MHMRTCLIVLLLLAAPRGFGAVCANPQDPAALGIDLSHQASCDPLVPEQCMLPFPNDYFTVSDTATRTRRHIYFTPEALPHNLSGVPLDAAELNRDAVLHPG